MISPCMKRLPIGGWWGGWECVFDGSNGGKLLRVPDALCPGSMVRWGQQPAGLEVLTLESIKRDSVQQKCIRMFPEVGCSTQNLSGELFEKSFSFPSTTSVASNFDAFANDTKRVDGNWQLCSVFSSLNLTKAYSADVRVRVIFEFDRHFSSLTSDIRVVVERRVDYDFWGSLSAVLENLDRAPRGSSRTGLDSQLVSRAIGARCFGSDKSFSGATDMGICLPPEVSVSVNIHDGTSTIQVGHADQVLSRTFDSTLQRIDVGWSSK